MMAVMRRVYRFNWEGQTIKCYTLEELYKQGQAKDLAWYQTLMRTVADLEEVEVGG